MKNNWILQTVILVASIAISWFIAISRPDLNNLEIGAIANQAFPAMLGGITLLVYGVVSLVQKKGNFNLCLFLVALNFAFGIYLYQHK
jgi:hypothetical protein